MLQIFSSTLSFIFLVLLMVFFAMQVYFYFYVISFVNLLLHLGHKKLLLYSGCRGIHPCFLLVSLFNMVSRLFITFLPRSKRLLMLWLQSPSAAILEPQKIKSDTVSIVSPSVSHDVMGPNAMIFIL